jgi:hypothetical protein
MLKESIYVYVDILGEREFDSIHELVKEYFRMYIEWKIDKYDEIKYRGYDLVIDDKYGFTDAMDIQASLISQIQEINDNEAGE